MCVTANRYAVACVHVRVCIWKKEKERKACLGLVWDSTQEVACLITLKVCCLHTNTRTQTQAATRNMYMCVCSDHVIVRGCPFVSVEPNMSPWMTTGLVVIETSKRKPGTLKVCSSLLSPSRTRSFTSPLSPSSPYSSLPPSIDMSLSEACCCDILYSLHFWPTALGNGFQILQGGLNLCQSWKWKAKHTFTTLCSYLAQM